MMGGVINAAANFAANALNAAKKALDSHSPSRKTDKLGSDFDQGFINAVTRRTADVVKAVSYMGKKAVSEFQTEIGEGLDIESMIGEADLVVTRQINQRFQAVHQESGVKTQTKEKQNDKKLADYMADKIAQALSKQKNVCEWNGREILRMYKEVVTG